MTDCISSLLKGQCHEIFCFWLFYESVSPQPQSIPLGRFQIFLNIRGDIRKSRRTTGVSDTGGKFAAGVVPVFAFKFTFCLQPDIVLIICHRCQQHRRQICRRYRWQICHRYQRHRRQILPPVPLVLLTPVANLPTIPVANLPPVSLTPMANNENNIRLQTKSELEGKNLYIC